MLEKRSFLHCKTDVRDALVHELALGKVLPGLVNIVEDMEPLRLGIPHDIFAAPQDGIEEDEEFGSVLGLGLELFQRCYSFRH